MPVVGLKIAANSGASENAQIQLAASYENTFCQKCVENISPSCYFEFNESTSACLTAGAVGQAHTPSVPGVYDAEGAAPYLFRIDVVMLQKNIYIRNMYVGDPRNG